VTTLYQLVTKLPDIPMVTAWYLSDLAEAKGRQQLYTRQSPQRLKVLREHAMIESAAASNRIEGVLELHRISRGYGGDAGEYKTRDIDIIETDVNESLDPRSPSVAQDSMLRSVSSTTSLVTSLADTPATADLLLDLLFTSYQAKERVHDVFFGEPRVAAFMGGRCLRSVTSDPAHDLGALAGALAASPQKRVLQSQAPAQAEPARGCSIRFGSGSSPSPRRQRDHCSSTLVWSGSRSRGRVTTLYRRACVTMRPRAFSATAGVALNGILIYEHLSRCGWKWTSCVSTRRMWGRNSTPSWTRFCVRW